MSGVLFFGHATKNVGDMALNTGAERLAAAAGARFDSVIMRPLSPALDARGRATFASDPDFITMQRDAMSSDALREYCEHPARLFTHYGLESADTVFIHSGEHLYAPPSLRDIHPLALWRILPAFAAKATGRRLVILPSTFGPFEHRRLGRLLVEMVRIADGVAAREPGSSRSISAAARRTVPAVLDPAFFLEGEPIATPSVPHPTLGLVMRFEGVGLRTGAAKSEERIAAARAIGYRDSVAVQLMDAIIAAGEEPVELLVQASSDAEIAEYAARHAEELWPGKLTVSSLWESGVIEYQDELARQGFVVASRFHACVLALARQVPAVGVSLAGHGHKMAGLFELIGVEGAAIAAGGVAELSRATDEIRRASAVARGGYQEVWPRIASLRAQTVDWLGGAVTSAPIDRRREAVAGLRELSALARRAFRNGAR